MFKVKNVLITGGLGGIGFDVCKIFIKKNFKLFIIDNLPKKIFNKRLSDNLIKNTKNEIFYKKVDLTQIVQIKKFFRFIKKKIFIY